MNQSNLHVIVGMGATGVSCARYLQSKGIPIALTDTRANPPQLDAFQASFPAVPLSLGKLDTDLLSKAAVIVLSPGVALNDPAIASFAAKGIPVVGDIELFAKAVTAPVIAITGTNAKSTVTTLVGLMMKEAGYEVQVGGNLGTPVLDMLDHKNTNAFVLELSSFQLETTYTLKPQVATILNITPDHMDRYKDLAAYQQAKQRVYHDCKLAVCNRDDLLTETNTSQKIHFTLGKPGKGEFGLLIKEGKTFLAFEDHVLMGVNELPVAGKHYQANALASLAIGYAFGLSFEPMLTVLRHFNGLPHRCQLVRLLDGVKWYNDSKGTNVGATQAAIEGLGSDMNGKLILIAGGVGKNADFHSLLPVMQRYARHVVLIGEAANELAAVIGNSIPVSFAGSMDEAVKQAEAAALPDDSVLLSPACASFDMFKNYEHRGDVFTEVVQKL